MSANTQENPRESVGATVRNNSTSSANAPAIKKFVLDAQAVEFHALGVPDKKNKSHAPSDRRLKSRGDSAKKKPGENGGKVAEKQDAGRKRKEGGKPRGFSGETGKPKREENREQKTKKEEGRRSPLRLTKGVENRGGGVTQKREGRREDSEAFRDFQKRVLPVLKEEPSDAATIANVLQLAPSQRKTLKEWLALSEKNGEVARIRGDRYIIPEKADLFTGEIQFHPNGAAHVLSAQKGGQDLFVSPENTSTAMHGDKVVARIFPGGGGGRKGAAPGRKEGKVIRILERKNERIVGTLQKSKSFFYVVADDPRFLHNLYVEDPTAQFAVKIGDKVVAHLESWPSRHISPEGRIVEVLGAAGAPGVDMLSIVRKYRLPEEFPEAVCRSAEKIAGRDPSAEARGRVDCRDDFVFTIDPDDAKDFDDAISVERLSGGGWKVAVHIADVSHYVVEGSPIDREAYQRGNSVYLPDRVIPMLPEVLSNGLCSLRPDEDRLSFAVFAEIGTDGKVRRAKFGKGIIRSRKRLTYRQALEILQNPPSGELSEKVHLAWEVSSLLRKKRFENGALDLDFPETKVWLDDTGKPVRIEKVENDISHQLIEELMLLANESVGRELRRKKQPTVYRVHESPENERLLEYRENALAMGVVCGDLSQRAELQKMLSSVRGHPMEYAIKVGLLKSLKRARYSEEPLGHYGLAKSDYLHFTSPIRRYADLVAHRALERHLGVTSKGPDSRNLPSVAEHISGTERVASDAEKDAVKLKKIEYFQSQLEARKGEVFRARILEVRNFGMFVELPDFMVSGLVHVSALEGDFFVFDPVRSRITGRKSKVSYSVGGELDVLVSRVDVFKQQIDFRPA